jgi:hypothetical protein
MYVLFIFCFVLPEEIRISSSNNYTYIQRELVNLNYYSPNDYGKNISQLCCFKGMRQTFSLCFVS